MRWSVALCLSGALVAGACGCRSNGDSVEAELRARENDVRELREELTRTEFYNQTLQREVRALRGEPGPDGHVEQPPEPYPVRALALGRQTGGRASENCPGDDALQVMVEPRDPEGQAVKAPGSLTVEVFEAPSEGLKRFLSGWQVPPEQLRNSWRNGLFNTGYSLTFPWKVWPSTEKLRVVARFRLNDGRIFEADKDVTVRLPPAPLRRLPAPTPTPTPEPKPPAPLPKSAPAEKLLPPPRQVEPAESGPALGRAAKPASPPALPAAQILRPVAAEPFRD